jgi:transposase
MDKQIDLFSKTSSGTIFINARCLLRIEGERRVIVVAGLPIHQYCQSDSIAEAYAMVLLADSGFARQNEVANAFSCSIRTVRRHQRRYAKGGMGALETRPGWRKGQHRISVKRRLRIEKMKSEGLSNRQVAQKIGVTEGAIRKQVGPTKDRLNNQGVQLPLLPELNPCAAQGNTIAGKTITETEKEQVINTEANLPEYEGSRLTLDKNAGDRSFDRFLAYLGLIDDAVPLFQSSDKVPSAGVILVSSGIFQICQKLYGEIGPAFYGLRTTVLTCLLMALLRVKRPESLKEEDPAAFGQILGLDRAPEVKSLRRKLSRLASYQKAEELGIELARKRVEFRGQTIGFLYLDGHVRAYHGKHEIPQTHVARRRLAMPATTDYWVNDMGGDPLFVMTAEANAGLVKIFPDILGQIREIAGPRHITVVFDRGGWSPKLFKNILDADFDILTYRKGKCRRIHPKRFVCRRDRMDGKLVEYFLHDQPVRFLKGTLRLRQVTRLRDNEWQTQVITSRWDLRDIDVAYRMFERWRQENFFKYMREEFLLDALVDYQIEEDDPTRSIPNPQRRELDKEIQAAKTEVACLEQAYGAAALDNRENSRPSMRGFKIANADLGKKLSAARKNLADLREKYRKLPRRIEIHDMSDNAVVKLATERKHLTDIFKMVAYQAESDLLNLLSPHYARAGQEGRTLLHEVFSSPADITVENNELKIALAPLSSAHRTRAVEAICQTLNESYTNFPGTNLQLRYSVHQPRCFGRAFPPSPTSSPTLEL